jgi:acyl carrier protein
MTFAETRAHIFTLLFAARGALHDPTMATLSRNQEADVRFADLELDSLSAMELCMNVEEAIGIQIDLGDLALHPSVNALAASLSARTSNNER